MMKREMGKRKKIRGKSEKNMEKETVDQIDGYPSMIREMTADP